MNKQQKNAVTLAVGLLSTLISGLSPAQTLLQIDASAPVPVPLTGHLQLGSAVSPKGETLGANNQYLTRNGKPWLPVMGEFHYSRSPADSWEAELRKMKSAGIDIVASYVIWNHHEEQDGHFVWSGNRDLRRFVQLANKVGLDVVVRVGPWAHAEARFGGIPDWVVAAMPTRGNDAQYLKAVERLYGQIGQQLKGQLWKDGGPVIAIQLENEYNLNGPGQGAAHISELKRLARQAGMDAPLYTVTGWDDTVYPSGEVTPVFGGYPDEPWGNSTTELPPKETYAFRFDSRVSGDLGAQTAASAPGTAASDIGLTPFLGAEYGAGLPAMYRRRTLVSPDDIASMLPVQLGSGVNLMGYYMFHGGRNPLGVNGVSTLEESSLSGGYNDTPAINYDFNAPLGPDGQQRPVLAKLRPFHYFLRDFGAELATMTVRKPALTPANAAELQTPRWAVRANGDSGFLFFNNHVRQYAMPTQKQIRFSVKLTTETLQFPQQAVDVADGAYFLWPINLDLAGTRLRYATAQPVARLDAGKDGLVYVFSAQAGIPVELGFDAASAAHIKAANSSKARSQVIDGKLVLDRLQPGSDAALTIKRPGARLVTLLVLTPEQTQQLSIGELAGQRRLLLSAQSSHFAAAGLELLSAGDPHFRIAVYPALSQLPKSSLALKSVHRDGIFQVLEAEQLERQPQARISALREAQAAPPIQIGGLAKAALQPSPESFKAAAAWKIELPEAVLKGVDDVLMQIDFVGDISRLFAGTQMLDDWYYNGQAWQIGLKSLNAKAKGPLHLSVLPLRADAPIYLPREHRPDFKGAPQLAELRQVSLIPVYRWSLRP
ncbi:beta-galactosidase [Roseateles oligotrophus]|uniref:Beta-galactosidase n=1 Tax=Roseateles oligotrophus TaxID=1769250 RepID=A0ABT2YHY3_9BURK|nr:beta-galactosidase [Roseateles oligotrophus]MCV2369659.1 beta-galactosidase [Roseateles oligotrophus]